MRHVGSYEAKTHLPELLDSVERGEVVIITRRGRPTARLMPMMVKLSDVQTTIAAIKSFGKQHRNRLKGISYRDLIEDGRKF